MRAPLALMLGLLLLTAGETRTEPADPSLAQAPRRWAMLPFQNASGRVDLDELSASLADLLTVALSGSKGIEMLDRQDLRRILQEKQIQLSASEDLSKAALKGGFKGVQMLIAGNFRETETQLTIQARLIDVETAATLLSVSESGSLRELDQLCLRLAAQLLKDPTLLNQPAFTGRIDQSPMANLHLARGLGMYWGDAPERAAAEFLKAVTIDPDQAEAAYWLAKSFAKCGLPLDAKVQCHQWLARWSGHPRRAEVDRLLAQCGQSLAPPQREFFQRWYGELSAFSNQVPWSISESPVPSPARMTPL